MNTAICMSGHLRNFKGTFQSLQDHVLAHQPCDIFIHTWDRMGWFGPHDAAMLDRKTEDDIEAVKELYKPKAIIVETQPAWTVPDRFLRRKCVKEGSRGEHIFGMFYGIKRANQLKREHEELNRMRYQAVIRSRFDVLHNAGVILKSWNLRRDTIWVDNLGHYGGVNDQFAAGLSPQMDYYAKCFDNLTKYVERGCEWRPEPLLLWHIRQARMRVLRRPINYCLLRPNGDVFHNQTPFYG